MGGVWRTPKLRCLREQKAEEPPARAPGALTEDEELRRQCLEWAFQRRDLMKVPHMEVVNVAQEYYDFVRNTEALQDQVAWERGRQLGGGA